MDIATIFENFGLPVAVIIALMWYIVYISKQYQTRISELHDNHKKETEAFTAAIDRSTETINRNTVVLERLCTMLGDKEGTTHDQQISNR